MHKTLERQLHKYLPEYPEISDQLKHVFEVVSDTYTDFDSDRVQLERSMEISSRELEEGNMRLAESSHLLQSAIDAVDSAIIVTDEGQQLIAYNRRFAEIWNFPNEFIGVKDTAQLTAFVGNQLLDTAGFLARVDEIVHNKEARSTDLLYCRDGRVIEQRSYPMSINAGQHARVWVVTDITELENAKKVTINLLEDLEYEKSAVEEKVKERTRELIEEHSRFLVSTSSIPFGFLVYDTNNNILIDNGISSALLGIEAAKCTFEEIDRAVGEVDLAEKLRLCATSRKPVEIKDVDVRNKILRILLTPMSHTREGEGELLGVVMLVEDTTEARTLERGRDEFFAIASHELRTPLTAIRGNMSIIEDYYKETITSSEVLDMIKDTNSAAMRLITIVNDFLDVSRLEQGRITFQLSDFSVSSLVDEVVAELKEVGMQKGIMVTASCPVIPKLFAHADYDCSKQVLTNLVSNAINYSERGAVSICVSVSDEQIEIAVRDEGIGITPQNQALLFRKFQQAGTSVLIRDISQSTGLGLYISRLIIQPMGGKIWLKSSVPGVGSEFAFTLPLASPHAAS